MKKILSLLLVMIIAASFCGCGNSSGGGEKEESAAASSADAVDAAASASAVESPEPSEKMTESSAESSAPESSAESSAQESKQESSKPESESKQESPAQESKAESKAESSRQSGQESSREVSQQSESAPVTQTHTTTSTPPARVEVTGIKLSDNSLTIYEGNRYVLTASMIPENATDRSFNWEWQDNGIISLSADGTITAKSVGMTEIVARTANNKTASCMVEVVKRPVYTPQPQPQPQQSQTQDPSQQTEQSQTPAPVYPSGAPEITGRYVGAAWFDDAVFVGDSVSVKLQYYADNGSLGNASFLCAVSLGYHNALWDLNRRGNVHPLYQGRKVTVDEGIRLIGKKKVFIMLGMNDLGGGPDYAINGMIQLTDRILQKNPDVQIYIQSVTPLIKGIRRSDQLNNTNVAIYNEKARQVCAERGFVFVNVAEAVSDSAGNLIYEYCGDPGYMGLHFSYAGCSKWVDYLKRHVA